MTRSVAVVLVAIGVGAIPVGPSVAVTTGEFMTTPQIREAIDGKALRLKTTVYGFFENGRARISNGIGQIETTWKAEAGSVCLPPPSAQPQAQTVCIKLWKDNLTGKFDLIFDRRPGDHVEANVRASFDVAVEELRQELLKGTTLTDAQRQTVLADQSRYQTGFSDPPLALGQAYKKYIEIRKCYDARADYEYVYVTDTDVDNSKAYVVNIEKYAKSISPTLNTQSVWDDVVANPGKYTGLEWFYYLTINNTDPDTDYAAIRTACQGLVGFLANTYKKINPKAGLPHKDF